MIRMKYLLTRRAQLLQAHDAAIFAKNLDRARRLGTLLDKVSDELTKLGHSCR